MFNIRNATERGMTRADLSVQQTTSTDFIKVTWIKLNKYLSYSKYLQTDEI